ncbi:hypothetical protein HBA54_06545 [Pelagibius litoralis]|uniref:Uncharacterized protein n=1 Tax=Pelagibius litoralis TaxID=374515 RepID=A0A967C7Y0_9PROT|nr:hypothetical protein [Pelagibius litoralis]NIA68247.1 hypothetical protein [Pelagibius litoralis]
MMIRTILAVVLGGAAGTLANAAAAALFLNPDLFARLAAVPNRYAIGILFAAALPIIYRLIRGPAGAVVALLLLTLAPSLLAKLGLGAMTAWTTVLALNFVYALVTLIVYRLVVGGRR